MINRGADIEAKTNGGSTPLLIAAEKGRLNVSNLLLENNANIEARTNQGFTPILIAICKCLGQGHQQVVKLLLGKKANIEARNHDGFSALYFAVKNNQTSVVDLLIEKGISLYDIIFGEPQFYCLDSGTAKRTHAINVCNGSPDCQDKTDEHLDICSKNDFLKTHDKPVYLKKTSVHIVRYCI